MKQLFGAGEIFTSHHSRLIAPYTMKYFISCTLILIVFSYGKTQSIELMPSTEYLFTDVQFFKPLDKKYAASLFSRTRAEINYDNEVSFFSAAYLNYTTKSGFGISGIGRMNNRRADFDAGIHFYKSIKDLTIFSIISKSLTTEEAYSLFTIFRFRPAINEKWKFYSAFELAMFFRNTDHLSSLQRIRAGLDYQKYQFGLAANLLELGSDFEFFNNSYGVFVRREF